jgi:DNA-binding NtrC family response regulator
MSSDHSQPVLVVEDDPIIAFDLETILRELACEDVVVFTDNSGAIKWLNGATPGVAILDFKLTAGDSLDTANLLAHRSVPTAFVTGYGDNLTLPATFSGCPVFDKPVAKTDIATWLRKVRSQRTGS